MRFRRLTVYDSSIGVDGIGPYVFTDIRPLLGSVRAKRIAWHHSHGIPRVIWISIDRPGVSADPPSSRRCNKLSGTLAGLTGVTGTDVPAVTRTPVPIVEITYRPPPLQAGA